jgi:hypothetical protein
VDGAGIDEVEEAGAAVEFGEEDGGVGLGLRGFDPVKAWTEAAVVAASFPEDPAGVTACPHRGSVPFLMDSFFLERERERERERYSVCVFKE